MKKDNSIGIKTSTIAPEMYPVIIYQIVRQCSNENNPMTMDELMEYFSDYWQGDKKISSYKKNLQRVIKRNLIFLMGIDSNICARKKNGELFDIEKENDIFRIGQLWYEQQLSPTEVLLLTDAIINSKHFSNDNRRAILRKLLRTIGETATLKTKWFETALFDAENITMPLSVDLYRNLELIHTACTNHECLSFDFCYAGPRGQKCKVRSFAGVSPYKIIHYDGTYYLVASRKSESSVPECIEQVDPSEIMTIEIHKLDKIQPDLSEFVPLEATEGKGMTIRNFMHPSKHPVKSGSSMFFLNKFNDYALLNADSEGLDILIEKYGNCITTKKINEIKLAHKGITPELRNLYEVRLNGDSTVDALGRIDWYELAILCLKHPGHIKILKPDHLMDGIIYCLENIDDYWHY